MGLSTRNISYHFKIKEVALLTTQELTSKDRRITYSLSTHSYDYTSASASTYQPLALKTLTTSTGTTPSANSFSSRNRSAEEV
jgi:hypothetical protein